MNSDAKIKGCNFSIKTARIDSFGNIIRDSLIDHGNHDNMVLNLGLSRLLSSNAISGYIHLGVGNTPVERTQAALSNAITGAQGVFAIPNGTSSTGTDDVGRYIEWSSTATSPSFTENRNVSEIGISHQQAAGALNTRALTKNSAGVPAAITVLAGEVVVVTYYFRIYMPSGSASGTINVTTDGVAVPTAWESLSYPGQSLSIGADLSFQGMTTGLNFTGWSLSSPVMIETGAWARCTHSKQGNTGEITVSGITSTASTARSLPVRITYEPPFTVSNDQRATISFQYVISQDYS